MNEEEKKSVNELKEEINKPVEVQGDKFNTFILYNIESAKTILNLIEKLQKENKELNKLHIQDNKHLDFIMKHSIPVQKVKDKIRDYQELQDNYIKKYDEINEGLQTMINVLQELIEGRK